MNSLQRTPEWYGARLGKLTGSRISDALATTAKGGWAAGREKYRAQLVNERINGFAQPGYVNAAMQWGIEQEPNAIIDYEMAVNVVVREVGFVNHPTIAMSGASPDGLVGEIGLVELKCPENHTHMAFLESEKIDGDYIKQMQWQMACTGRQWCDFVSFDPRCHINMRIKIIRVRRDDKMVEKLEREAVEFLKEVEAQEMRLRAKYNVPVLSEAA